jgi:hypothetical protein
MKKTKGGGKEMRKYSSLLQAIHIVVIKCSHIVVIRCSHIIQLNNFAFSLLHPRNKFTQPDT